MSENTETSALLPSSNSNSSPPRSAWPQTFACLAACLGSFVMGTAIGWSGPAISLMQDSKSSFVVSDSDANWIASLMPLGALFGGPLSGTVIGRFGRRATMFATSTLFALSYAIFLVAAQDVPMVLIGRMIIGLCCGVTSCVVPVYVAETASSQFRGRLGSMFQVMVTFGIVYVDVVGAASSSWRWLSVACVFACLLWSAALIFVPESPDFLLTKGRNDEAREALLFLNRTDDVDDELEQLMEASSGGDQQQQHHAFSDLFLQQHNLRPLLVSLVLMVGQQLSGVNAVIFFSVKIFEAAGTKLNSFVENIVVAIVQVLGTFFAVGVIDRTGRRVLLLVSAAVMAVAQVGLGTYFWILDHNPAQASESLGFLPLVSLCIFIFFFAIGFGPIPWLMMGELFSPDIKSKASSVSACFNWTLAFLVTQFYGPVAALVGSSITFWFFACVLVVIFFLCFFFVPETKGRSLEDIQAMFREHTSDDNRLQVEQEEEDPLEL